MFIYINNAFPMNIEDKNKVSTICIVGGNDAEVGVAQYVFLNEKAEKDDKELICIYSRYADHN